MKYFLAFMLTILAVGTSYGQQRQSEVQGAKVLNLGTKDKDAAVSDSSDLIQVSGNFVANGSSVNDGGLGLGLWANSYSSAIIGKRTVPAIGGMALRLRGRSSDTAAALTVLANKVNDTTTTAAALIGSADQNGAWTLGPTSFTGTQTVNGRKVVVTTSPGSVSIGTSVSPNAGAFVSSVNLTSFMSVTHTGFLEFDSGSAKFVQITEGGGGRAALVFCDFASATCLEIADPSGFFSISNGSCGTGVLIGKVAAANHIIRVRNCSGITLNLSIAVLGSEVLSVGNQNTSL